tara:strand:+ start:1558 stop:1758 length:201 start_codon:yes stop_codon:yes gene_type:complete
MSCILKPFPENKLVGIKLKGKTTYRKEYSGITQDKRARLAASEASLDNPHCWYIETYTYYTYIDRR